jgi:hypothetical protein
MNDQLISAITIVVVAAFLFVATKFAAFFKSKMNETTLNYLNEILSAIILEVQQEYKDADGATRLSIVTKRVKEWFPDIIKSLNLTDTQLEVIIKAAYEYLHDKNIGNRFETTEEV